MPIFFNSPVRIVLPDLSRDSELSPIKITDAEDCACLCDNKSASSKISCSSSRLISITPVFVVLSANTVTFSTIRTTLLLFKVRLPINVSTNIQHSGLCQFSEMGMFRFVYLLNTF